MPKVESFQDLTLPSRDRHVEKWRWLYQALRSAIIDRRLRPGSQLPSTRDLARQQGLARGTVTAAYAQLLAEGFAFAQTGAGTFVSTGPAAAAPPPAAGAPRATGLTTRASRALAGVSAHGAPATHGRAFRVYEPALDLFPAERWARTAAHVLRRAPRALYGHGDPIGYLPLRRAIAEYVGPARGVRCVPEQVLITAGAQHALSLLGRLLLDLGDAAWVEDPGYPGVRQAWRAAGARLVHVPADAEGMRVSEGRRLAPHARLAYVTPANQFPLGTVMSADRRLELLDWASASHAWIVEDDYDAEYRYAGRPVASLQSVDRRGTVIYVGTFTKMLFNALRLGFMVLPEQLVDSFARARSIDDRHPPTLDQATLTDFIVDGHFGRHVRRMRQAYAERLEVLLESSDRALGGLLEVQRAGAGMRTIGWLTNARSDRPAAESALAHGLEVVPLSAFAEDVALRPGLVLGFASVPPAEIRRGVAVLARALSGRSLPLRHFRVPG